MESAAIRSEDRARSEARIETLFQASSSGETVAELAHDARNMVTALGLYCELLDEPGVLNVPFRHYSSELRMAVESTRRLLERMLLLPSRQASATAGERTAPLCIEASVSQAVSGNSVLAGTGDQPIVDLRAELLANRSMLSALAGPSIAVSVVACGGTVAVRLRGEELTRILVNLVRNAAEAIRGAGAIRITLGERLGGLGRNSAAVLSVEDSGCGIPEEHLERIFESGFTSQPGHREQKSWMAKHRGLGLAITRAIVEGAGGRIYAQNRAQGGARFEIELPAQVQ
jgi:signal transduction histidine kinase